MQEHSGMSAEIRQRHEALAAIGSKVTGTQTVTAFTLAERELAK